MKLPIDEAIREAIIHRVSRVADVWGNDDTPYGAPFDGLNMAVFATFESELYES